jgi:hypothetical protein
MHRIWFPRKCVRKKEESKEEISTVRAKRKVLYLSCRKVQADREVPSYSN